MKYLSIVYLLMAASLAVLLASCEQGATVDAEDVAIRVNNAVVTTEEFNEQIKMEAYVDPEMDLSDEDRQRYVKYLIQKELMIQEAMKLKLDRKDNFIKTIEKYWESTLVRKLLDVKTQELKKKVLVTEEELVAYYDQNRDEFQEPYEDVKDIVKGIVESRRLKAELDNWADGLQASADIHIKTSLTEK
ncbi:MAG: hypothetical protein MI802_24760 [Desulfobacterales bacterium]|nr:hypothetical protein [Desulfobacterales bacterium]